MVRLAILMMMLSILSCKKKDKDSETSIVDEVNPEVIEEELERSSATGSGPESASLEIDSDNDGLADIDDACPNDANSEPETVFLDADGDGKGDIAHQDSLCPSEIADSGQTYVSNSDDIDDTNDAVYVGASCGSVADGALDSRVRYKLTQAPVAGTCEFEVQNRQCTNGVFSGWDGDSITYPEDACNHNPDNPLTVTVSLGPGASNPLVVGDQVDCSYTAASANDVDGDEISSVCTWSNIVGTASNCSYTVLLGDASADISCSLNLVDGKGGMSQTVASSNSISVERPICNFAGDAYDGSSANGQDGTPAKPYYLCTKAQFEDFLDKCTDVSTSCAHSVSLQSDINLGLAQLNATKMAGKSTAYTGEFNGNGHTVQGIKRTDLGSANLGALFGTIGAGGIVRDLHLDNVIILGAAKVGGMAASCDSCTIQRVYLENLALNNLVSSQYTGGLLANALTSDNTTSFTIEDVYLSGSISSDGRAGGLIGSAAQSVTASNQAYVSSIYVAMSVQSSDLQTGGLLGTSSFVIAQESLFAGSINASDLGNNSLGGLVGLSMGTEGAASAAAGTYYSLELSSLTGGGSDGINDKSGEQATNAALITAMSGFSTDHWKADVIPVNQGISYLKVFETRFE